MSAGLFAVCLAATIGSGVLAYSKWGAYGTPMIDGRGIHREFTPNGQLRLLEYDAHGRHKIDTWSYFDRDRVVRTEVDEDGDGVVDTWYYYDAAGEVEKTGFSRRNNGVADTWRYETPDGTLTKIEYSETRDGAITRTEFYDRGSVVRTSPSAVAEVNQH